MRRFRAQSSALRFPFLWTGITLIAILGMTISMVAFGWPPAGNSGHLWIAAMLAINLADLFVISRWSRRVRRTIALARSLDGGLCTTCLYPLPDFQHDGTCPECGAFYFVEENLTLWGITRTPGHSQNSKQPGR